MVRKKLIAEGIDFYDAREIMNKLMMEGHKVTIDPLNGKFWIFDYGKQKR